MMGSMVRVGSGLLCERDGGQHGRCDEREDGTHVGLLSRKRRSNARGGA